MMLCEKTPIDGALVIGFDRMEDDRGFFGRIFCREALSACGAAMEVAQANISGNLLAGTLRGLHYQAAPHAEDKLVRVVAGAAFDVAVDLREGSPTYGKWHGVTLSRDNFRAFFIPKGCAHGYYTTEDGTELVYFASSPYAPLAERGVAWDDPRLAIAWPGEPKVMSAKDRALKPHAW
ncbi:MAG: dTDP-4-dehydrorhamnose 3,5-epimerase [Deltaproteobacteria bacterium]|jgi:dTDP-4-dehydrorhamnose 3,5-epimerase|nr:dTDP-4-dehydrorhamnose 3,5-epimerase [Deltaproteobacteria bacterium]